MAILPPMAFYASAIGGYFAVRHFCLVNFNDFLKYVTFDCFRLDNFNDKLKTFTRLVYTTLYIYISDFSLQCMLPLSKSPASKYSN